MSVCGGIVDFKTLCCGSQVVVDFVSRVVYALHVVVLVEGGENDKFVGIVCHSFGLDMIIVIAVFYYLASLVPVFGEHMLCYDWLADM